MSEWIKIPTADGGTISAYLALPAQTPAAALVLVPEVFNVNDHIRAVADSYAADGFLVLAPDLYWRQEPETYLPYDDEGLRRARLLWAALDVEQFAIDVGDIVAALRARSDCTGKVGILGFCIGGTIAYLASAKHSIDAAVSYYGIRIHEHLDLADQLRCQILFHFAESDAHIPLETVKPITERAAVSKQMTIQIYEGAGHGFNRKGYSQYHEASARLARERTLAHLGRLTS
ncbi:MAG: dienelactone hydrolase family protein [Rhizobiales bacterium]|nr:dienelactone hydrolase family protein [Hyphomicrobiales bacterium]